MVTTAFAWRFSSCGQVEGEQRCACDCHVELQTLRMENAALKQLILQMEDEDHDYVNSLKQAIQHLLAENEQV